MTTTAHGANFGHGYTKYVYIDDAGREHTVIFPSMIGQARPGVAGALGELPTVHAGGAEWWTGEDAQFAPSPLTILSQQRLHDPVFLPALVRGALERLTQQVPDLRDGASGFCVTGLPATWVADAEKRQALGARLREGHSGYARIRAIAEPLGPIYAALLDTHGQIDGDPDLQTGQVGVVDLGQLTVDVAVVRQLMPVPASLQTFQLGMAEPLGQIRALLSSRFDRDFSLFEVDGIVRARAVTLRGRQHVLPPGWDRALIENGQSIAARLGEAWKGGGQLDAVIIAGGGAEVEPIVAAILGRFPHAEVLDDPQLAVAQGYARLARRWAMAEQPVPSVA